ncbi:MAG TPA: IS110 family transposase [Thermomicrobiales bacterium]|jgi:transposase
MLTVGVDAHKRTNMAVAIDVAGREVARWHGSNSIAGWQQVAAWAAALDPEVRWGIEGAWNYGRGLAQQLVEAGATVYEVNARWTAAGRRRARTPGKSDGLDARAVALVVSRETDALPPVTADDETAVLDLLVGERDGAVAETTRLRNQLHQLLLHLDPDYRQRIPSLKTQKGLRAVADYATSDPRPLQQQRAAAVRRLAQRLALLVEQARELAAQIRALAARRYAPLVTICGVDLLTAAALAGILGPGRRFASDAQLAAYAGVAPLEASSAERVRHRLNRGGNRQLNAILYRIALTQARCSAAARAYLARRASEGKTKREALRALKRFIVRAVWRRWQECLAAPAASAALAA